MRLEEALNDLQVIRRRLLGSTKTLVLDSISILWLTMQILSYAQTVDLSDIPIESSILLTDLVRGPVLPKERAIVTRALVDS